MNKEILVCGHRGHCVDRPEQTMISYVRAIELGADFLELDVRLSADRQLVVIHDKTLERTTNGSGLVQDHVLQSLCRLNAGTWFDSRFHEARVPTLKEVLLSVGTTTPICIEIKSDGHGSEIASVLAEFLASSDSFSKHVVSSFDINLLANLKNDYSEIRLVPWMPEDCAADLSRDIELVRRVCGEGMFHTASILTKDYVCAVQELGLKVWLWCDSSDEGINHAVSLEPDVISCGDVAKVISLIKFKSKL